MCNVSTCYLNLGISLTRRFCALLITAVFFRSIPWQKTSHRRLTHDNSEKKKTSAISLHTRNTCYAIFAHCRNRNKTANKIQLNRTASYRCYFQLSLVCHLFQRTFTKLHRFMWNDAETSFITLYAFVRFEISRKVAQTIVHSCRTHR